MKTLKDVIDAPPDSYIEGGFEATVTQPSFTNTKAGKTMFKCVLVDGALRAHASAFKQTFEHWEGKRVRFSGKGIKRRPDYSGTAQIGIGDQTIAAVVGGAASVPSPATGPGESDYTPKLPPPAPSASFSRRMDDMQLFYQHCYVRANNVAAAHGFDNDVEGIRNVATTFYIQGQREGLANNPPPL
jgi:hypothetical protein